ncbi:MAG: serine/threonine protein kinase [Chitinispirillia bacterium]|nr:serine/threonine protein kinase [Chitinispirillia bacterium]MCL2267643.1 serine/threonine protein kinase [Chitinispirillia bacterium]
MHIPEESEVEKTFVERAPLLRAGADGRRGGYHDDSQNENRDNQNENNGEVLPPRGIQAVRPVIGKTQLGSGLVTDIIGSGGMASIYKVWNERLEVFRAVKLLSLDALYDRFETEAKLTAKLRHPNIVEIYGVGEWNGLPYMEMEFIDGENMQQVLGRYGRFPDIVCGAAALRMADALAYAHGLAFSMGEKSYNGIIHRDLKPANIMFSKHGDIKLTDFGIARPTQASLHTKEGNIVGTLHYLSPEQMEGAGTDQRSDIYSFGAILYEMATGSKTFPQESITELMRRRADNSYKKLSDYGAPISSELANIITRCLKANPNERYHDIRSLIRELQETYSSMTDIPPQTALANFYPVTASNTPYTQFIRRDAQKTKAERKPRIALPPTKTLFILIPAIMLTALLLSYITVRMISSPPKTPSTPPAASAPIPEPAVVPGIDTAAEPAPAAPEINTAKRSAITMVADIATEQPTGQTIPLPKTPTPPEPKPISEDDLIRDATAAMNRKDWNRAARILERTNIYREKANLRTLLLLETYIESKQLDKAKSILDDAARTNDAHYYLCAGRYWLLSGNHTKALEFLESSLIRSSISKSRNLIFDDAIYYIAIVRSERFRAAPSEASRAAALDGWRRVQSAYRSRPDSPRLERAEKEAAALN